MGRNNINKKRGKSCKKVCDRGASAPRLNPVTAFIRASLPAGLLLGLPAGSALAGPEGGVVAAGQGSIANPDASTTVVNQASQNLIVNWESFNVNTHETVNFKQPNKSAQALNRIFDQNPSQIFGSLNANGKVLLINPNGVFFSPTARVNVGGLVASGLNIKDEDFMAGKHTFFNQDGSEGGMVVNQGLISAATGGSVTLIGGAVKNEGTILATAGQVNLVAGKKVTMDFDGDGLIQFTVDEEILQNAHDLDDAISNSGTINADGGSVLLHGKAAKDVFTNVVNNSGVIGANKIQNEGGQIKLVASGAGNSLLNTGIVDASSSDSDGGNVEIHAEDKVIISESSIITTASETGNGGKVQITGDKVGLTGDSIVDASGDTGGGEVLIGGDLQGKNPDVVNAAKTYVGKDVSITADAVTEGDGGKVIVWADDTTHFYGDISSTGGALLGDGGFVEVSGKELLNFKGLVDLRASQGGNGTLLLDPTNIEISAAVTSIENDGGPDPFTYSDVSNDGPSPSILNVTDLVNQLALSDVIVTTASTAGDAGDITLTTNLDYDGIGTSSLTLVANNNINITGGTITDGTPGGDTLNLTLNADSDASGAGSLTISQLIETNNGTINLLAEDFIFSGAGIDAGSADIFLTETQVAGPLTFGDEFDQTEVDLLSTTGTITFGRATDSTGTVTTMDSTTFLDAVSIDFTGTGANIVLAATSTIDFSEGGDATGSTVTATNLTLDTTGGATVTQGTTTPDSIVASTLTFVGDGTITLNSTANDVDSLAASGTTAVTFTDTDAIDFAAANFAASSLNLTTGDAITDTGTITISGVTTLNANAGASAITLNSTGNDFDSDDSGDEVNAAGTNITLVDTDAIVLGDIDDGGDFVLTAGGAVTQTVAGGAGTNIDVTDTTSITATGNAVTLTASDNDFGNEVSAAGTNISLRDTNDIELDDIDDAGDFTLITGGAVTQTAAGVAGDNIDVTGTTDITSVGFAVTLDEATNDFGGAVTAAGTNISLTDIGAIELGDIDDAGDLVVVASAGAITQTAAAGPTNNIDVTGTSSFTATGNAVTLNSSDNNFTGAVSAAGTNISLRDTNAIVLDDIDDAGDFTLITGGAVTQTAAGAAGDNIDVTGTTDITSVGFAVTLDEATNDFGGVVSVAGTNISLRDTNAIQLDDIDDAGDLVVVASAGAITQTAAAGPTNNIDVTGTSSFTATGNSVTLNSSDNNFTGAVSAAGTNISLRDTNVIVLDDIDDAGDFTLITGGAVTQTAAGAAGDNIDVTGTTDITSVGFAVTLDEATNDFGGVVSVAGTNISLRDTNAIQLDDIDDSGAFTLTAGGAVTQTAAGVAGDNVDVTGTTSITATGFAVTLDQATNDFVGAVSAAGTNISLTDANSLVLGTVSDAGDFVVNFDASDGGTESLSFNNDVNVNSIAISGTSSNDTVNLGADADITAATGDIVIGAAQNITGIDINGAGSNIITATAGAIDLTSITGSAAVAELELNAGTNITLADVTLNNGAGLLDIDLDEGADGTQTLDLNGDIIVGSLTVDGQNANDTVLIGSNVDITTSTGDIAMGATQNISAVTLDGAGSNTLTATAGAIDLAALTDAANITNLNLRADTGVTLDTVTLNNAPGSSTLDIRFDQGGDDAAALNVTNTITVGTLGLVLGQGTNDTMTFGGLITTSSGSVSLSDAATININGGINAASNINIDAVTTVNAAAGGNSITGTEIEIRDNNNVGTFNITGTGLLTIDASSPGTIALADITDSADADLTINAGAGITAISSVNMDGGGTLTVDVGTNAATGAVANFVGTVTAGVIDFSGFEGDDVFNIQNTLTATAGSVTIDTANTIDVANIVAETDITIDVSAGVSTPSIDLNGTSYASNDGNITLTGAIDLDAAGAITFDSDADNDATDGNINLNGAVNDNSIGDSALIVDADTGDVSLNAIGTTTQIGDLTITGNDITFNGNVESGLITATGVQNGGDNDSVVIAGGVTLDSNGSNMVFRTDDIAFPGSASLTSTGGGTSVTFAGETDATTIGLGTGSAGTLQLTQDELNIVDSTFTEIIVGVDGTQSGTIQVDDSGADNNLTIDNTGLRLRVETAPGDIDINSTITLANTGSDFNIEGAGDTTLLSGDITTNGGDIIINDTVLVDGTRTLDSGNSATAAAAGLIQITGDIGSVDTTGDTLTLDARSVAIGGYGAVDVVGDVGAGTVNGAAANDLTGFTVFADQVDVANIEVTSGDIALSAVTNIDLNGATYQTTTSGSITIGAELGAGSGTIDLDQAGGLTTIQTAGGAGDDITIESPIRDGDATQLTLNAGVGGDVTADTIGAITPIGTVDVDGDQISLDIINVDNGDIFVTGNNIDLNSGFTITTAGEINVTGPVVLTGTGITAFTTPGGAGDNITFSSTIDDNVAGDSILTLDADAGGAGNVTVGGAIGGITRVRQVDIDGVVINVDSIRVDGVATGAANIFVGTLGTTTTLNLNGANYDSINSPTSGIIRFDGPVTLNQGAATTTTVSSTSGADSDITFRGTVNDNGAGNTALVVNSGATGNTWFQQAVGGATAIESLTVTNAAQINVDDVTTTGDQSYTSANIDLGGTTYTSNTAGTISFTGPVELFDNVTVTTAGAGGDNISFSSTIDADDADNQDRSLTLTAGAGDVTVTGAIGGTEAMDGGVTISGATISTDAITTDGTDTGANKGGGAVTIDAAGGTITVGGEISAIGKGLIAGGAVDIDADGTNAISVQGITTNSTGINGGIIKLNDDGGTGVVTLNGNLTSGVATNAGGAITLGSATALGTDITISTGTAGGDISFDATLDSEALENNTLDLTAGTGSITFTGAVGSGLNQALGAITVNSATNLTATSTVEAASFTQTAGTGTTTFSAAVDASAGDINVTANAIVVDGTLTTSSAGTAGTIQISNNVTVNAALDAGGDDIILNGGAGTLTISALISDDNPISLTATDDIIVTGTGTVQTTGANDITLTADTGPADGAGGIWVQTGGLIDSGQNIVLNGSDIIAAATADAGIDIQANGATAVLDAAGTIDLNHNAATADTTDMVINGLITSGSSVTVESRNDIIMGVDGDITSTTVTATDAITLTADTAAGALGGIVDMADGTIVNAGAGLIDINADGNIDLGLVTTSNSTAGAVNLNSDNGAITDADGAAGADVTASTGGLVITAEQGVVDIETEVAQLNVTNNTGTPAGNIVINEADDVLLVGNFFNAATNGTIALTTADGSIDTGTVAVSTQDGAITLTAGDTGSNNGSITVGTNGIASNGAGAGDIILNAADGVALGGNVNALADTVTINADTGDADNAGAISRTGGTVSGSSIDLDAATGIVAVTATDTLAVDNSTTGAVDIDNAFATLVTVSSLTTAGVGNITFDQTGGGDVTFTSVDGPDAATLNSQNGITLNNVASLTDLSVNVDTDDNTAGALLDLGNGTLTVTNTISLSGGTDNNDTLRGQPGGHTWVITGANAGLIDTGAPDFASFTNIGTISGDDSVIADTIDQSDVSAVAGPFTALLTSAGTNDGMAGGITGLINFDNIDAINGSGAGDSLTGFNTTATWTLDGGGTENYLDTGSGQDLDFTNDFNTLTGGAGDDTFNITTIYTADLIGDPAGGGNDGSDSFVFDDGANPAGTAQLIGSIDGGVFDGAGGGTAVGNDSIDFSGSKLGLKVTVNIPGTDNGQQGLIEDEPLINIAPDTDLITAGFDNINALTGNGLGVLLGPNQNTWWNVTGTDTGFFGDALTNITTGFNNFSILGGNQNDVFIFQNAGEITLGIDGGLGNNILAGTQGADTFNINDTFPGGQIPTPIAGTSVNFTTAAGTTYLTNIDSIDGTDAFTATPGTDTDTGADIFNITVDWSGSLNGVGGNDSFVFTNGVTVGGSITGGTGSDTLDWTAYNTSRSVLLTASTVDGFSGTEASITGGFVTIDVLTGGTVSDTLTGRNVASTWTLDGTPQYTDGTATLDFSAFEVLQGGTNTDAFNVTAASAFTLLGGTGVDTFDIDATLTGSLDGEVGADILQGDLIDDVLLTGSNADGFTGTEADITANFDGISVINGNGGTLTGQSVASTWNLGATQTYNNGSHTLTYTGFANLQGGTNTDAFNVTTANTYNLFGGVGVDTFTIDATLTGSIDGETGADVLQGTAIDAVFITSSDADGYLGTETDITGGFDGIANITGNGGTLTGSNTTNTWSLAGTSTFDDGTADPDLIFSGFANLQGGTNTDAFNVTTANAYNLRGGDGDDTFDIDATLTGLIDGEGQTGVDILQGDLIDNVVLTGSDADGFAGTEPNITGGFDGIETLTGNGGTLQGRDVASTWNLDGTPTYSDGNTLNFTGFANLQGGSDTDAFNLNTAGSTFNLRGGAGVDTFDVDIALTGLIDGEAGADILQGTLISNVVLTGSDADGYAGTEADISGNFDGIQVLTGAAASLTGENVNGAFDITGGDSGTYSGGTGTLTFTGVQNLTGGSANDTFTINGGTLSGTAVGGAGTDTLIGGNDYVVTGANSGTVTGITGGWSQIENLTGTAGADTFNVTGGTLSGLINGAGGGDSATFAGQTVTLNGTNTGISNIETVNMGGGTLVGSAGTTDWNLNGASAGTADDGSTTVAFTNTPTVRGGTGTDTFTANGAYNGTVNLTDLDNTWNYTPGATLTNGAVTGSGSLTIPGTDGVALDIAGGDLVLPNLAGFNGHTIIGGALTVPGATPYYTATAVDFNTTTLTVTDPINSGGSVTLLGGDVILNNDITLTSGTIGLVAGGPVVVPGSTGIIDASAGPVTLTAPPGAAPSGAFVASDNLVGSENITLAFGGGEVDLATGAGEDVEFNGASISNDIFTDPQFEAFVNGALAALGVNITTTFSINPASALIGLETLAFIDLGLFEEELQLFGTIGTGIALALAQCEEQEGCAPNVTEDELNTLIATLEARIEELRRRLEENENTANRVELEGLIEGFNKELQAFNSYLAELQDFFSAEAALEEELEDDFIDEEPLLDGETGADEITVLAGVLETIQSRIDWLESLKEDPEERNRLSEATGIELTLEELDKLIEAARAEAAFIENRIRLLIEGTEARLGVQPIFTAEARNYDDTQVLHYGPGLLELDNNKIALKGMNIY